MSPVMLSRCPIQSPTGQRGAPAFGFIGKAGQAGIGVHREGKTGDRAKRATHRLRGAVGAGQGNNRTGGVIPARPRAFFGVSGAGGPVCPRALKTRGKVSNTSRARSTKAQRVYGLSMGHPALSVEFRIGSSGTDSANFHVVRVGQAGACSCYRTVVARKGGYEAPGDVIARRRFPISCQPIIPQHFLRCRPRNWRQPGRPRSVLEKIAAAAPMRTVPDVAENPGSLISGFIFSRFRFSFRYPGRCRVVEQPRLWESCSPKSRSCDPEDEMFAVILLGIL